MTDANHVVNITQSELQQLVCQNASGIRKPEKRMVRKHCTQTHGPSVEDGFMAETAEACMTMHDLDALSDYDIAENRKKGEHSGHGGLSVDDQKGNMIHLEAICQVPNARPAFIRVRYDDDLVASINEFC